VGVALTFATVSVDTQQGCERAKTSHACADQCCAHKSPLSDESVESAKKQDYACENPEKAFQVTDIQFHMISL
jgi:hypothetical protein